MKALNLFLTTLISLIFINGAQAQQYSPIGKVEISGDCLILLKAQCKRSPNLPVGKWFVDSYLPASQSAARCVERAQQYKNWCKNVPIPMIYPAPVDNIEVTVVYRTKDGAKHIGAATNKNGRVYLTDGISRGIRFVNY